MENKAKQIKDISGGQIVLYQNKVEVRLVQDTFWLSLNQMADLFERDKSVISRHLLNIFKTEELDRASTVAFFATVQKEGGRTIERNIEYFNLDAKRSSLFMAHLLKRETGYRFSPDLMIKKYNGKSQPCMVNLVCQNKNNPKGDLPWIKVTNLTSAVNTFTWAWMSIRRVGA